MQNMTASELSRRRMVPSASAVQAEGDSNKDNHQKAKTDEGEATCEATHGKAEEDRNKSDSDTEDKAEGDKQDSDTNDMGEKEESDHEEVSEAEQSE